MKALQLNLFALLVSFAFVSCQKEDKESSDFTVPNQNTEVWNWHVWTSAQPPNSGPVKVTGTLIIHANYHVKHYIYVNNKEHFDTSFHTIVNDSIYYVTKDGESFSGSHYVQNDTLYSAIAPGKFYK